MTAEERNALVFSIGEDVIDSMTRIVTVDIGAGFEVENVTSEFGLSDKCDTLAGKWRITVEKIG